MSALDREKARDVLRAALVDSEPSDRWLRWLIEDLEGCVVPDPRWEQIEALLKQYEEHPPDSDWYDGNVPGQELRAILRGDQ